MNFFNKLLLIAAFLPFAVIAQKKDSPKPNWFNLDLQNDGVFGVSTEKAYSELLKGKKSVPVIVAVIDGGVQSDHEDLKRVMYVNPKEIASNNKDDDKNGFADDVHGWNFLGSSKASVRYDNLEVLRMIRKYEDQYAAVVNSTPLTKEERAEFNLYKRMVTDYMGKLEMARFGYENYSKLDKYLNTILERIGKKKPDLKDFDNYKAQNEQESKALKIIKSELRKESDFDKVKEDIEEALKYYSSEINYHLNVNYDPRDSIGDIYTNGKEHHYGNDDVTGPDAEHGTHVAGIIGADRTNTIGIKGVADNVRIMSVRAVPDGDERDKDVANAIIYAVDNGAKVINMSFGKSYSWDKKLVDSAVRYAASKDVLLVHAAGNEGVNTDVTNNFPNPFYADDKDPNFWNAPKPLRIPLPQQSGNQMPMGQRSLPPMKIETDTIQYSFPKAANWIEVGASGWKNDGSLVASFSNYGKRTVDIFAPGVKINSTIPKSKYKENDGTSMASPVVAGVAALIRSYFPSLSAVQVKDILMKSVAKVEQKVKVEDERTSKRVNFTEVCVSGGIVNAYNAVALAEKLEHK
ncbi:Protease precursor [Arcticibacter svalbardensis MN12-7]|uniref:Protease n=1 Tax=Arcticibacter svalbardensis MN12-7 TaxID=1150600 RepID=R9GWD7_9SPHI|nr:S8 family peptidase [Arcticibacter svalbardensis]EOR93239.1 Protease precursor [Arcticibacter svalbardensis MN12-7]